MQPNHSDLLGPRRPGREDTTSQMTSASRPLSRSAAGPGRIRAEGEPPLPSSSPCSHRPSSSCRLQHKMNSLRALNAMCSWYYYADSWVEIASQPSSSSLSSIGDEIVTTGLNVQNRSDQKRRRRLHAMLANNTTPSPRPTSAAGSSQDEYDESSSESDRLMSSSNEEMARPELPAIRHDGENGENEDEDDEDDTSTALGTRTSDSVFTPQPNAFSHPPSSQTSRTGSAPLPPRESYFPSPSSDRLPSNRTITARDLRRPSISRSQRSTHSPYNMISPSHTYQPDHDAALRASLSTLLSCAAAARGLPKRESRVVSRPSSSNAVDANTIRMVSESEMMSREESVAPPLPSRRPMPNPVSSSSPSPPSSTRAATAAVADVAAKRKAVRETSKDRNSKKSRGVTSSRPSNSAEEMAISPTLMTWVVSAGVVILFSAISFSAGFVFGREVGRMEAGGLTGADLGNQSCAQEIVSKAGGFRRLRWSAGTASVSV